MERSPTLVRAVSRWQIVGLGLNDVVGSGVYLLPAAAAALLGPSSVWAVMAAGAAVAILVLVFAEASSHFDEPGSAYLYARTAFGSLVGLEVGLMAWIARVASVASLSVGFSQALGYLWPPVTTGWGRALVISLPILILTGLNIVGVRFGVGAAMVLLACKMLPLLLFVSAGVFAASLDTVAGQPPGSGRLGEAALLLLFAYAGFENTPAPAGEYRNPRRDVPFALITNVCLVTLLYSSVQWIALGILPNAAASATPLADAAGMVMGGWAGTLLTLGAALSILGTNSNSVLAGPRYLLALARDGFGPAFLGRVHPRFHTPAAAILVQGLICLPLALTGTFTTLATLSVVARLATYLTTAAAVPVLRRRMPHAQGALRLPAGDLIAAAAVVLSLGLAASATMANLLAAGAALAVGAVVYATRRR
ncbi:MAG: APC family permease [Candidatus Polarisedimenticolia bacterium]